MSALTFDDLGRGCCRRVRARREVCDSPLAARDSSAPKGALGEPVDVDHCNEVVFVDFGAGAIACTPDELEVAR